ncbi:Hypothetical predicted protein [Podarcis lilfordi]|uniref:Uncharacterized protein n=1 Tax=Podarcis lilfordi TaxID=74358 RepID=A0AA35PUC1_9SAUR|nr:Hypothetical predicted protein [Podarcis lilfordi]
MGPLNANDEYWPLFRRHSLDPVTNFAGTCLFLMALRLNLVILNGLSSGDCPGQFTYWSGLRHSVIDYILVSQELFDEYIEFTVDTRTESDHLPLNLKRTEFWEPSRCGLAPQTPDPSALQQIGRSRIKWSPYVNNHFGIWTQSMEGQLLWADLTSNDTEETSPIDHYNTLIRKLQPLLSRPRRSNQNDSPTNKKWFDHECTQAKLILRECFKVFQQNPNPITKLELQLKKKNYKELLKTKKEPQTLSSGRKDNWSVKGNAIEQTKTFQYLGITFSYNAKFSAHLTTSAISAERSANAILRLFRRKGAGFLPMALTVFQAKSLAQLLYGSQISPSANLKTLETVQSKFLRSLFATPKCTPNAVLRQEAGLPRVELKVWEQAISLWLKIHYNPKGLLPCFLAAVPYPPWLMQITNKIKQIGLNPENIFIGTLNKAKATITRRLYDIELQQEGALLPETYRCLKAWPNFTAAPYLTNITSEAYRWAFSRARFETMPSAVLYGKFTRVPMHARLCPCMSNKVESVTHILLSCEFYSEERAQLILPLLSKFIPLQYYLESSLKFFENTSWKIPQAQYHMRWLNFAL